MFHLSSIDTIDILSRYDTPRSLEEEYIVSPFVPTLVEKYSTFGSLIAGAYRVLFPFSGVDHEQGNFHSFLVNIAAIFDEIRAFQRLAFQGLEEGESRLTQFKHLSKAAQELYGACFDHEFFKKMNRVVGCIIGGEYITTPLDSSVAQTIFSEVSGIPLQETGVLLAYRDFDHPRVQRWITAVNKSCLAIMSPELLSSFLASEWVVAWRLYNSGLKIGIGGRLPLYHEYGDDALSGATRHLGLSWRVDGDYAIIHTEIPLLFGLWTTQMGEGHFLFPPIQVYSISSDGQSAVVEKPHLFFSSPKIWDDLMSQAAILSFLDKILSLSLVPDIDLASYCVTEGGEIKSLCPIRSERPFSWERFESLCFKIAGWETGRVLWIYERLALSGHRDVQWARELFSVYGISLSEQTIMREMTLDHTRLQGHATEVFQAEISLLRDVIQDTYRRSLERGESVVDEGEFIRDFFVRCDEVPRLFPTSMMDVAFRPVF